MSGQPRKKRIRSIGEDGSSTTVFKVGSQASCSNYKKTEHNKASCKEPIFEQTPKPKRVPCRLRKNQSYVNIEDVDIVLGGPLRDEGTVGSRGGVGWSRRGVDESRRGVGGSRGGASGSKGGASRSKRKVVSSVGTQKRQGKKREETSGFAKWFGLQDESEQTQDEPEQTQDEPV
nr:hypothetical protein [Tanacetum cinerariifolium]